VALFQGLLESEGLRTFAPDQITKVVDPFITGGNALLSRLQVPEDAVETARDILAASREAAHEQEDEDGAPETAGHPEGSATGPEETPEEEVESFGRRTRWGAVMGVTAPLAILYGICYLSACREHGIRAKQHGLVVSALVLASVLTIGFFGFVSLLLVELFGGR
jgi:hypothetical protein